MGLRRRRNETSTRGVLTIPHSESVTASHLYGTSSSRSLIVQRVLCHRRRRRGREGRRAEPVVSAGRDEVPAGRRSGRRGRRDGRESRVAGNGEVEERRSGGGGGGCRRGRHGSRRVGTGSGRGRRRSAGGGQLVRDGRRHSCRRREVGCRVDLLWNSTRTPTDHRLKTRP